MEELTEVLAECELADWARWLATSTDTGDRETLLFLERVPVPSTQRPAAGGRDRRITGVIEAFGVELWPSLRGTLLLRKRCRTESR